MNQASRRGKQRPDAASVTEDASVTDAAPVTEDAPTTGDSPPPDGGAGPHGVGQGEAAPHLRQRSKPLRLVMSAAVLFTAWHLFASLLWIAPPSPARDVVPGNLLTQYMIPFFGQSWSVFAPEPINGDHRLFVRAVVATDGTNRTTEWVNATEVETRLMTHQPFPARAASQSINVASTYRDAYGKLTKDQKAVVARNFSQEGWSASLDTELTALANGDSSARSAYLAADFMSVRYATQVARAIWGQNVVRVQFRVERQNVIPFKQRHDPDAQRPEVQLTPSGWRGLQVAAGQSDQDFADTFRRLYKEVHP
ncbi:DUF5819 family protein [Galactobacter caseinivorans]|nr:DUF5819 family protein [Galactobacter caseinivorans]